MKIVIAIDSFKGSLSSLQTGSAVKDAILRLDSNAYKNLEAAAYQVFRLIL